MEAKNYEEGQRISAGEDAGDVKNGVFEYEYTCKYCGAEKEKMDGFKMIVEGKPVGICAKCLVKAFDKALLKKEKKK